MAHPLLFSSSRTGEPSTTRLTSPDARPAVSITRAASRRAQDDPPPVFFTSTNKVYGGMEDVRLRLRDKRYEPADPGLRARGFSEDRPSKPPPAGVPV